MRNGRSEFLRYIDVELLKNCTDIRPPPESHNCRSFSTAPSDRGAKNSARARLRAVVYSESSATSSRNSSASRTKFLLLGKRAHELVVLRSRLPGDLHLGLPDADHRRVAGAGGDAPQHLRDDAVRRERAGDRRRVHLRLTPPGPARDDQQKHRMTDRGLERRAEGDCRRS